MGDRIAYLLDNPFTLLALIPAALLIGILIRWVRDLCEKALQNSRK